MRNKFLIVLTVLLTSCSQPKPKEPSEYVNIDFRNLSIQDFVKKVSEITGKKIIVDREIKGKINFVSNTPIQVKELIPLTNAILETHQLTLVNKGSCYTIVKSSGENVCICGALSPYDDNISQKMMTKVFQLDNLNSAVIRTKIKPLGIFQKQIYPSNGLIVTSH